MGAAAASTVGLNGGLRTASFVMVSHLGFNVLAAFEIGDGQMGVERVPISVWQVLGLEPVWGSSNPDLDKAMDYKCMIATRILG